MELSDIGAMALICREGVALGWYRDSKGVPTIGVGHTAAAGPPDPVKKGTMTVREAFDLFRADVRKFAATVERAVKAPMAQHEYDAFVSICYNIGQGAFAKATFVKRFNAGDKAGCAECIMDWTKDKELVGRRTGERDQFLGAPQRGFTATIYEPAPGGRLGKGRSINLVRALQIAEKPPQKPVDAQEPPKAAEQPAKPEPAPAKPAGAAPGAIVAVGAGGVLAALGADNPLFWVGVAMVAAAIGVVVWSVVKRRQE